jgi:hypothetical protein
MQFSIVSDINFNKRSYKNAIKYITMIEGVVTGHGSHVKTNIQIHSERDPVSTLENEIIKCINKKFTFYRTVYIYTITST